MTRRDVFKFFAGIPASIPVLGPLFGFAGEPETISYPDQVDFSIPPEHRHLVERMGDGDIIASSWEDSPPLYEHWEARTFSFEIHDAKTGKHLESRWTPYIAGRQDSQQALFELMLDQVRCERTWTDRGYQIESKQEVHHG